MNTIITRRKIKSPFPQRFKDGQEEIKDPGIIAHKFGEYFTNLVPSLAKKIPNKTFSYRFFWETRYLNLVVLIQFSLWKLRDWLPYLIWL